MEIYLCRRNAPPELPRLAEEGACLPFSDNVTIGDCVCAQEAGSDLGSRGGAQPRPAERRAGRHRSGGRAGRALNDRARGQVTPGATFPGAQPAVAARAGLGPGPNWEARGADRPKQSCWAGGGGAREEPGSWSGGGRRTGPARPPPPPPPPRETAPRGALRRAGSQGGATERSRAPPFLPSLQPPLQQRGRPAGGERGEEEEREERAARPKLGSRPAWAAEGERAAAACRGLSPAAGEGEPGAPEADRGDHREPRRPPALGSFLQPKNSPVFGKLGASAPVPGLHRDCFVFGGTTAGQEDCTSQGQF